MKALNGFIFASRWLLYPINVGLLMILSLYIGSFLYSDYLFFRSGFHSDLESLMVEMLGFVDASMVANLIIMIVQGGHQIFIRKFTNKKDEMPQYLDHIDTGILKVKVALSIAGITLVQLLKDFVDQKADWAAVEHRIVIHCVALLSALIMAVIWRITHPTQEHT